jgi:hypothetical protein
VAEPASIDRDLRQLEADLKRLEAEYNKYFSGRLARPPWETRSRVAATVRQLDRAYIQNYGDRFRFATLQSRFSALVDLWDRALRAREEGRAGPFAVRQRERPPEAAPAEEPKKDRIVRVTTFHDPARELDRLQDLYESLVEARREVGEQAVPFDKFARLVTTEVGRLQRSGSGDVALRVMVKDGKVSLTARALKGAKDNR